MLKPEQRSLYSTPRTDTFAGCKRLEDIYCESTKEEWISVSRDNDSGLLKVLMGEGEAAFPIETHNVLPEDVRMNEAQVFELISLISIPNTPFPPSAFHLHRS